jgi:hypothetical protein
MPDPPRRGSIPAEYDEQRDGPDTGSESHPGLGWSFDDAGRAIVGGRKRWSRRMRLEGSCHCQAVRFHLESPHPYPFNLCYCSICRKTAGSGGFAINLGGRFDTLHVEGRQHLRVYRAWLREDGGSEPRRSPAERHFCGVCGSALWLWDPRWPDLVHPHASAIDTPLPKPPERTHLLLDSKAPWVEVRADPQDKRFDGFPDESIAEWHERLGLSDEP